MDKLVPGILFIGMNSSLIILSIKASFSGGMLPTFPTSWAPVRDYTRYMLTQNTYLNQQLLLNLNRFGQDKILTFGSPIDHV